MNVAKSDDNPRLWLGRIYYANNQDRQRMLEKGVLLEFGGVRLLSGREFGVGLENTDYRYSSGKYASELLDIIKSPLEC